MFKTPEELFAAWIFWNVQNV